MQLLVIDNYDSFTYNLVQYFGELNASTEVIRNDSIAADNININSYNGIVVSPGPCDPDRAGISLEVIKKFAGKKPIFGVCLGHQCIAQAFGGKIIRAEHLMHGKTSPVQHGGENLFKDLPNPLTATRYHSLLVDAATLPDCIEISAHTKENEIMGLKHKTLPIWGVQFHPESLATEKGIMILKNFLDLC
ncbi:MAG: aminodeoxychorismate/anthranilate synthase component II [Opitutae bacterium]|jgi:anthranilate synthase/aminodeoxychorismate synthase-like glutamine amidotransferase|nr:aminodeoxychorismate/anthranilate synthase component II [Opitutae bacterium]